MRWQLLLIVFIISIFPQNKDFYIRGKVLNENNEPLPLCNIIVKENDLGTSTDEKGNFSLKLPEGNHRLDIRYVGYQPYSTTIKTGPGSKDNYIFKLVPLSYEQKEVTVLAEREELTISAQKLLSIDIKNMPTIYSDVLRSIKILPGVSSNNELSSSYNVRGGNYDENLLYLNGYEIFRPFLLRVGVEENQSLVNPDMVKDLKFYGGGYPARFGDKMSSALEVDYKSPKSELVSGTLRVNLLNAGLSLSKKINKDFNLSVGFRYAYPGFFLKGLQTKGSFNPKFYDVQILSDYNLSENSNLELFIISAYNKFNLTPSDWEGHFQGLFRGDYREIRVEYQGDKKYDFGTNLFALRYKTNLDKNVELSTSLAVFNSDENENVDLEGKVFYSESATPIIGLEPQYLKTKYDFRDNGVKMRNIEGNFVLQIRKNEHLITGGISYKNNLINYNINEKSYETGDSLIMESPLLNSRNNKFSNYQISLFAQDIITLSEKLQANIGLRNSYISYNKEYLFSPRISLHYYPDNKTTFRLSTGIYYQPPFYYEMRNNKSGNTIYSQKSIHFIAGFEKQMKNLELNIEAYYKDMHNLLAYYIDELNLVYDPDKKMKAFAWGVDLLIKGQIIPGTRNWISYSYLDTKEREMNSTNPYKRRLLDQTHSLQLFIQDEGGKSRDIKAHLRIFLGSGFLYHPRSIKENPVSGNQEIVIDFDQTREYSKFLRFDLGLSWYKKIGERIEMTVNAEVLNVFDNVNALTYSWVHVMPENKFPFQVASVLSRRNINLGVTLNF